MPTLYPSGTKKLRAAAICGLFLRGKIAVRQVCRARRLNHVAN
jgi:hypothetical protein